MKHVYIPTASYTFFLGGGAKSKNIGVFRNPEKNIVFFQKTYVFFKCLILLVFDCKLKDSKPQT